MGNFVEYGRLFMSVYLPREYLPDYQADMEMDEFYRLFALAEIVRDLKIQDIEVGVNRGYVEAFSEE